MTTEASFEARVTSIIQQAFPWVKPSEITHQDQFSIKLGHDDAIVKSKSKSGRSDILISIAGTPTIILELKAPGKRIDQEDIRQGLSYSRLTTPITPITIVSDSIETKVLNSFTGEEIANQQISSFSDVIKNSLTLAGDVVNDAIHALTGGSSKVVASIFENISSNTFRQLSGDSKSFEKPFCNGFSIDRDLAKEMFDEITSNTGINFNIITGPAQSGKTNTARQLCELLCNDDIAAIYIDTDACEGVLSTIERAVYSKYRITLSSTQTLNWVRNYILKGDLFIILDRMTPDVFERLRGELVSLISLFEGTSSSIIAVADNVTSQLLFKPTGRKTASSITEKVKIYPLDVLSTEEFIRALDLLQGHGVHIDSNNIGTPEFRQPKVIRAFISLLDKYPPATGSFLASGVIADLLSIASDKNMLDDNLMSKLQLIGLAFICQPNDSGNAVLDLYSMEVGCVNADLAKKYISDPDIALLRENGVVEIAKYSDALTLIYPRDPLIFTLASAEKIAESIRVIESAEEKYLFFISNCARFPSSDLLAVHILKILWQNDSDTFSSIIHSLLKDSPKQQNFAGRKFDALIKFENTVLNCKFDLSNLDAEEFDSELGVMCSDYTQWRILSILLCSSWFVQIVNKMDYLRILYRIASHDKTLFRIYSTEETGRQHATHTIGKFEIACVNHGKIEPVTMAIESLFRTHPEAIVAIAEYSIRKNNFPFISRLQIAFHLYPFSNKLNDTRSAIDSAFKRCCQILTGQLNQERNEACICQSGLKYKKCCGK